MQVLAEKYGYLAVIADSGQEVLTALSACETFNVILMDWKMPDMDGIECTKRIQGGGKTLKEAHAHYCGGRLCVGGCSHSLPSGRHGRLFK